MGLYIPVSDKRLQLESVKTGVQEDQGGGFRVKKLPGKILYWELKGLLPLALKLAHQSPCEPKTLNRAARDYLDKNPKYSQMDGQ